MSWKCWWPSGTVGCGQAARGDRPGRRARGIFHGLPLAWCGMSLVAAALATGAGCAPAPAPGAAGGPVAEPRRAEGVDPARSGSLTQEQISVRLNAGALRIEVTPLAAWVLEAAAPDAHDRLLGVVEAHEPEMARRAGISQPVLFLVSLSSRQQGTEFQPADLHMASRGLRQRPLAIRAITPGWGSGRLSQQVGEMAVYAYGDALDLTRELTVSYQGAEDSSWSRRVAAIEAERGRIGRGGPRMPSGEGPGRQRSVDAEREDPGRQRSVEGG